MPTGYGGTIDLIFNLLCETIYFSDHSGTITKKIIMYSLLYLYIFYEALSVILNIHRSCREVF